MKGRNIIAASALGALVAAGCGSSGTARPSGGSKACKASIGIEAPITGPVAVLGQEQLHFAQLALSMDNKENKTKITLSRVTRSSTRSRRRPSPSSSPRTPVSWPSSGRLAARRSRPSVR